jgi:hypothetical protein
MLIVGNRVFQCVFLGLVLNLSHYVYMLLLHLSIFYEYQQFFQHRICFSIQPPDYSDSWPRVARSTILFLIMLFNNSWYWIYHITFICDLGLHVERPAVDICPCWRLLVGCFPFADWILLVCWIVVSWTILWVSTVFTTPYLFLDTAARLQWLVTQSSSFHHFILNNVV